MALAIDTSSSVEEVTAAAFERTHQVPGSVLLVDDDPQILEGLRRKLECVVPPRNLWVAGDGEAALGTLDIRPVDLLVTSLTLPDMDGRSLLRQLRKQRFRGRTAVMSRRLTRDLEIELRDLGVLVCLPKPIDVERLLGLCRSGGGCCDGEFRGFSPVGMAQLIDLEGRSCLLRMQHQGCRGDLVFSEGRLVDAWTSKNTGENAALVILAWPAAHMKIYNLPPSEPACIDRSLSGLILEAATLYDEQRRQAGDHDEMDLWLEEEDDSRVSLPFATVELPEIDDDQLKAAFRTLLSLDGIMRAALVDLYRRDAVYAAGPGSSDREQAADCHDLHLLDGFGPECSVEDILTTLPDRYHLMRPLRSCRRLLLHVVLERAESNLALARHCLSQVELSLCDPTHSSIELDCSAGY